MALGICAILWLSCCLYRAFAGLLFFSNQDFGMRYRQYLLISILCLCIQSCVEKDTFLKYDLEPLKASIKLPGTYSPLNKGRLDRILNHEEDQGFKDELLSLVQGNKNIKVMIDTINPYKFILIEEKVSYVRIDTMAMYILIDSERKKSSSRADVSDSIYFVGSKLDRIGRFRFIESKHTRKSGNRQRIGYSFIISDDAYTSGISFFSPEEQDSRKYITTISKN